MEMWKGKDEEKIAEGGRRKSRRNVREKRRIKGVENKVNGVEDRRRKGESEQINGRWGKRLRRMKEGKREMGRRGKMGQ